MAEQWIDAATALKTVVEPTGSLRGGIESLCDRARTGLVRSRAKLFLSGDQRTEDVDLPAKFWWAGGHEALAQNWSTGDFSTWIDRRLHLRAYGVTFALLDLLEMLAVERRALVARSLSVVGDPAWTPTRVAIQFAHDKAGISLNNAGAAILDRARLGFVTARAVLAQRFQYHSATKPSWAEREWDVPVSFWREFALEGQSEQNWELGVFEGWELGLDASCAMRLEGVHFLAESLQSLLPASPVKEPDETAAAETSARNKGGRPPQPWWDDMWCAVTSLIIHGALVPKRQSDVENAMLTWAAVKGHEISQTAVKPKAKKLFEAYQKEVTN